MFQTILNSLEVVFFYIKIIIFNPSLTEVILQWSTRYRVAFVSLSRKKEKRKRQTNSKKFTKSSPEKKRFVNLFDVEWNYLSIFEILLSKLVTYGLWQLLVAII